VLNYAAAPVRDAVSEPNPDTKKQMLTRPWVDWFAALGMRIDEQTRKLDVIEMYNLSGGFGVTPIPLSVADQGIFRITYYTRIMQQAATSSSVQVTIGWTDGAITCFQAFPPMTGNTQGTTQSNTIMVRNDQASPLTYQVTYASNAAGQMRYSLVIMVEQVG